MTKTCRLIKFFIFIFYSFCSRSFLKRNPFLNKHSSSNQKPGFEIWIHRLNSGALYEKKANITQDLVKVSIVRTMSAGLVEKLWKCRTICWLVQSLKSMDIIDCIVLIHLAKTFSQLQALHLSYSNFEVHWQKILYVYPFLSLIFQSVIW